MFVAEWLNTEERRDAVERELARQEAMIGTATIRTTPPDAQIWIDGERVSGDTSRLPVELAEGRHTLLVIAEGYVTESRDLTLKAREILQLNVELRRVSVAASLTPNANTTLVGAAPDVSHPVSSSSPTNVRRPSESDAPESVRAWLWPQALQGKIGVISVGAGLVSFGVGLSYGLPTLSTLSDRTDANRCSGTSSCTNADVGRINDLGDTASIQATVANVGMIAGGVLVLGGIGLMLTSPEDGDRGGVGASVASWATAEGAGLALDTRW